VVDELDDPDEEYCSERCRKRHAKKMAKKVLTEAEDCLSQARRFYEDAKRDYQLRKREWNEWKQAQTPQTVAGNWIGVLGVAPGTVINNGPPLTPAQRESMNITQELRPFVLEGQVQLVREQPENLLK
jgi:hypothetical protein